MKNLTTQTLIDEYNKHNTVQLTMGIFSNHYITMKVREDDVELCQYNAGRQLHASIQDYLDCVKYTPKEINISFAAKWCIAEMRSWYRNRIIFPNT